ncbi:MAG: Holliday junction branch migration protein RuvA [Paracoccaceae bacterium]|nr:Holliday junction branch migration protein RuvA [Paracoccaceae bacterium]
MISKITGLLSYKGIDHVLIDVHGIGYEVFLAESTLAKIPNAREKISVHTELVVREDLLQLVGFSTRNEREWYRLLTGVQGVGSKAALKILGALQTSMLYRSILTGDANAIKAAPGIGPKIAQRIVAELKDKAPALMALGSEPSFDEKAAEIPHNPSSDSLQKHKDDMKDNLIDATEHFENISSQLQSEALSALTNLGYASYDAALAVSNVLRDQDKVVELQELIKLALKNLSSKV